MRQAARRRQARSPPSPAAQRQGPALILAIVGGRRGEPRYRGRHRSDGRCHRNHGYACAGAVVTNRAAEGANVPDVGGAWRACRGRCRATWRGSRRRGPARPASAVAPVVRHLRAQTIQANYAHDAESTAEEPFSVARPPSMGSRVRGRCYANGASCTWARGASRESRSRGPLPRLMTAPGWCARVLQEALSEDRPRNKTMSK